MKFKYFPLIYDGFVKRYTVDSRGVGELTRECSRAVCCSVFFVCQSTGGEATLRNGHREIFDPFFSRSCRTLYC